LTSAGFVVGHHCGLARDLQCSIAVIRKRKWFLWTALVLFTIVGLLGMAALIFPQKFLCVDDGVVRADVMVVLGGGSHDRPERAAELFRERAAPRILVSGRGDCNIYRHSLIEIGVPPGAIQLEDQSRNSRENAIYAVKWLRRQGARHVIIVTSWYHSRRALACFEHYAPEIEFYSRPSYFGYAHADWSRSRLTHRIYLEYPKLLGYWMCYGVSPF
jgi:uncharacterized SAM-binding protein YcdF (DUF218 family)